MSRIQIFPPVATLYPNDVQEVAAQALAPPVIVVCSSMIGIQFSPPVATLYPNDVQEFAAQALAPPAMWTGVTDSGDIGSDFALFVDLAQNVVTGNGAHQLFSGIGIVEFTIDDRCRPTTTGRFTVNAFIFDINGFTYFYGLHIDATAVEVRDENNTQIYTESYTTLSGDIYRIELAAGFRLYRNGVLKHSRVNLGTTVIYPMYYQASFLEPNAAGFAAISAPRLIGDWRLAPVVTWTAPSHGSIS